MLALSIRFSIQSGITDLLLSAFPKLRSFYRVGFFEAVGISYIHPVWGSLDVMRLDLQTLMSRLSRSDQPLARLIMDPESSSARITI
jgi:hypothetical protein